MELSKEVILRASGATLAVVVGLGLTACAKQEVIPYEGQTKTQTSNPNINEPSVIPDYQDFGIRYVYTESGKRFTIFGEPNPDSIGGFTDNVAFCDGVDLVEMPIQYYSDGGNSVITRSVGHIACADGRLDPSDFK